MVSALTADGTAPAFSVKAGSIFALRENGKNLHPWFLDRKGSLRDVMKNRSARPSVVTKNLSWEAVTMYDKIALAGLILAMLALWTWDWALMRILLRHERQLMDLKRSTPVEQRCDICTNSISCEAANSGVIYPCPYYENLYKHWKEISK